MADRRAEERVELKEILAEKVYNGDRREGDALDLLAVAGIDILDVEQRVRTVSGTRHAGKALDLAAAVDGRVEQFFQDVVQLALDKVENRSGDRRLVLELLLKGSALKVDSRGGARPFDCARPETRVKGLARPSQLVISLRIGLAHIGVEDLVNQIARDSRTPGLWLEALKGWKLFGDLLEDDAVVGADLAAGNDAGPDIKADLAVL